MSRRTYPRPDHQHAATASEVLRKHALHVGHPVELPVPIESIIEHTYGLQILWEDLTEPPGTIILGALEPRNRRIVLNARREQWFETWLGPERFTLAHELAHWIYDADDPNQLPLGLMEEIPEQYCYHRESPGLTDETRIREINANKLAAHLLLPGDLVCNSDIPRVLSDLPSAARDWQVSKTTLQIRLKELGLLNDAQGDNLTKSRSQVTGNIQRR
ncbi:MAG: ImmA/IrrE family metallo-endopeptidase [Chloroflexota bacterium]|nr:ImmA/IrrE family metallo-endopeptidase [Chloroflexota bacterium]